MPDGNDPIERARLLREAEEKQALRRHKGWESDPPNSDEAWIPGTQVREGRPGDGNPSSIGPKSKHGFRTGLTHISEAIGGMAKRIAFLLGLWGTISTAASVGFTYWFQAHIKDDLDTRLSKQETSIRSIEFSSKIIETTAGQWSPRITKVEEIVRLHGEAIASLRPTITATTNKRPRHNDD